MGALPSWRRIMTHPRAETESMIVPGGNAPLEGQGPFRVVVTHGPGVTLDLTAFLLDGQARVRTDDDMVFYNAPSAPGVTWQPPQTAAGGAELTLLVDPDRWPASVERVRIGLTVDGGTFGRVQDLAARVVDARGSVVADLDLSALEPRVDALIVGDVYRRGGQLKVRCEAAGFTDGLAGLARDVGVQVDEEPAAPAPVPTPPPTPAPTPTPSVGPPNFVKQLADQPPPAGASPIDLRKHKVAVALVKNQLDGLVFRVVLAIDASGSMDPLFSRGTVQRSVERMVPIADLLDDNHEMEVWYFGSRPARADSVRVASMGDYVTHTKKARKKAGWRNEEPKLMDEVIGWVTATPSPYPTLVLAWSDGGIYRGDQILDILVQSSSKPIFWMWLGLGRANYAVLQRLDQVTGGVVDNAGFIEIDDIDSMADDELYGRIFPFVRQWYADATAAGVITPPR
jgi:stress response protein SCP2